MKYTLICLLLLALTLDLVSCHRFLQWNRNKEAHSGFTPAPLIFLCILPINVMATPIFTSSVGYDCAIFIAVHLVIYYLVPLVDKQVIKAKERKRG